MFDSDSLLLNPKLSDLPDLPPPSIMLLDSDVTLFSINDVLFGRMRKFKTAPLKNTQRTITGTSTA